MRGGGYPLSLVSPQEEGFCKAAIMAGLQKTQLPKKYREMVGCLVAEVEMALDRRPELPQLPRHTEKEAGVICISDIHAGKQSYDDKGRCLYNKDICAFRLSLLKQKLVHLLLHHIKPGTIDEIHLLLLGDIVDGAGIYPGQELHQDINAVSGQIVLAVAGIWDIIESLVKLGYKVFVWAVRGNHGQQGKYVNADNNFDYLVYQLLYMMSHYSLPSVQVVYAATTEYLNAEIKGKIVHMRHQAPSQPETAAARAKFGGYRETHKWDFMTYGHLHHPGGGGYCGFPTIMNGSPVGQDDLSERLGFKAIPSQTFFGISTHHKTFHYDIYLDTFGSGGEAEELLRRYPMLRTY
jgi:hypothetical protein